jgi:formylglycine-generating enzyme required for sulfatase activity
MEAVLVGNAGNVGELSGAGAGGNGPDRICGAVDYAYKIGTYEVTAGQYAEFLNAVAASDPYGLYNVSMDSDGLGCQITQNGTAGSYTYDFSGRPSGTEADWANRPVNYVSWGDAARFANWLHNGQPTGAQGLSTTEDGSYFLDGAMSNPELMAITREPDATWVIPSEDEWYKAAYHKNDGVTGNYFDYPTSNDSVPSNLLDGGGNNATYFIPGPGDGFTIGAPYYRTEVGAHVSSESPYDTFDQGGNVWEWTEAAIGAARGFRGGSFFAPYDYLHAGQRWGVVPTFEERDVGFRVASEVPEPIPTVSEWGLIIMAVLVLAAGVVVLRSRRRTLTAS